MKDDFVSARGERAAMGGYVPQFNEFARLAYRELVSGKLTSIRLADPKAFKLDDIQYVTRTEVHAYQVKWSIAGGIFSFVDFKALLPGLFNSWQRLRNERASHGQQVIAHLLTNQPLSVHDKIVSKDVILGSFTDFYREAWLNLETNQPPAAKWEPVVAELHKVAKANAQEFADFAAHFIIQPEHKPQLFSSTRIQQQREDADLVALLTYLLEQISSPVRQVEFQAKDLIGALGWEGRFRTTFNHELFVDVKKYQPLTRTLDSLDEKLGQHPGGYLFLEGGPGSGKSTLLTQWAKGRAERIVKYYAFDFSDPSPRANTDDRGDATRLYFDLVIQLKAAGFYDPSVLPYMDGAFLRNVFTEQIAALAQDFVRTGRQTILIIDGLDHVPREYAGAAQSFLRDLPRPSFLPKGVFVVLGSQTYELQDLHPEIRAAWQQGNRTIRIAPLSRHGVGDYLAACQLQPALTAAQQQAVYDKSKGHPLYLSYLSERLQNGEDAEELLAHTEQFDGNINAYYQTIWQPIEQEAQLVELLGLMARVNGAINPAFITEWGLGSPIALQFRKKASFLFSLVPSGWSFFHNSFRQFLLQQTALDHFTGTWDTHAEAGYHQRLASFYIRSATEPTWHANYHYFRAGDYDHFLAATTLDCLGEQWLDFRPAEEIRRDAELGIELARQTRNVGLLSRYVFALTELNNRLFHLDPAGFTAEFLAMNQADTARNYLRSGRTLRVVPTAALQAARHFYSQDPVEAAMLFELAEPENIQADGIMVGNEASFEEAEQLLGAWIVIAHHFRPLPQLLLRLQNIVLKGKKHRLPHEKAKALRLSLLEDLAQGLIEARKHADVEALLASLDLSRKSEWRLTLKILHHAIEQCRHDDDGPRMRYYLDKLVSICDLNTATPSVKILVADLIYKASGDLTLVRQWIAGVPQPVVTSQAWSGYDSSLQQFRPFIVLNKLLHVTGQPVAITSVVPTVQPGADEQVLVDLQQKLCLMAHLLAEGLTSGLLSGNLLQRVRPIVRFYYQEPDNHNTYWFRAVQLQSAYFEFLLAAVAPAGLPALQELTVYLFKEFEVNQRYWEPKVQRTILLALHKFGLDDVPISAQLRLLEPAMLEGLDISGKIAECTAQARAWHQVREYAAAAHWLRQALRESFGVGYRKDYQFTTWLDWLLRINAAQPAQAPQRIQWFLSHLQHLRDTTEGRAYWRAAEKLLEVTFAWNFAMGQQQLQWQLDQGLIDFEAGLEKFIAGYLNRAGTEMEYVAILPLYCKLFLLLSTTAETDLLHSLLVKGFDLLGTRLFNHHLPSLIEAIERRGLEEKRPDLLVTLDEFVTSRGHRTVDYYPGFVRPPVKEREGRASGNVLVRQELEGLPESEVIAQASGYEELVQLLEQEARKGSYFRWEKVLQRTSNALTAQQVAQLAELQPVNGRKTEFYSALSHIALTKGDRLLAQRLADNALALSGEGGWLTHYDGGSRLKAFAALQALDSTSATSKAFDVFAHDAVSGDWAGLYAEGLDDILPCLTPNFRPDTVWEEVFAYLQRLMATSQPITGLPNLAGAEQPVGDVLASFLKYLSQHPVGLVQQRARDLLAERLEQGNTAGIDATRALANDDVPAAEAFVEILMLLPLATRRMLAAQTFRQELLQHAVSTDYWLRRQARRALTEAGIPLPAVPFRPLPAVYALTMDVPSHLLVPRPAGAAKSLINPFGFWLEALAEETGLEEEALTHRAATLMQATGDPTNWTKEAERALQQRLDEQKLRYSHPRPRVEAARRALMQLITELLDSNILDDRHLSPLFTLRDYQPYQFPEVAKPAFVLPLRGHDAAPERKAWLDAVTQHKRLAEGLVTYAPDQFVIGESTLQKGFTWERSTETYQMQLSVDVPTNDEEDDDGVFGSVYHQLSENYHAMRPVGPYFIVVRNHRFHQFDYKSRWLALNPAAAKRLGWKPDPSKLFAWQSPQGQPMVESVYWANGNVGTWPYHSNSEAGEGWLVLASSAALQQLGSLSDRLVMVKKVTREQQRDGKEQQKTVLLRVPY